MKKVSLSFPELLFIAATRGALGAGLGLLLSGALSRDKRRAIGLTLATIGALATIPAVLVVFGRATQPKALGQPSAA